MKNELYTINLLDLSYSIINGDYENSILSAEAIVAGNLTNNEKEVLRDSVFSLLNIYGGEVLEHSFAKDQLQVLFTTLTFTNFDYIIDIFEFNQLNRNGMSVEKFKDSSAYKFLKNSNYVFFTDKEMETFFRMLANQAIGLRSPELIKFILDKMREVTVVSA